MLSDAQNKLIASVLEFQDYAKALPLLFDHLEIINDEVVREFLTLSLSWFERGRYREAATIADLALNVREQAEPKTRIDLFLAAGQAFCKLDENDTAGWMYERAEETARDTQMIYRLPVALIMLARLHGERRN